MMLVEQIVNIKEEEEEEEESDEEEIVFLPKPPPLPSPRVRSLREELVDQATSRLLFRGLHPLPPLSPPTLDHDALRESIKCSICLAPMEEAQILHLNEHCIHRFCWACITTWLSMVDNHPVAGGAEQAATPRNNANGAEQQQAGNFKLLKKTQCPLCTEKANIRMPTPDAWFGQIVNVTNQIIAFSEQNLRNFRRSINGHFEPLYNHFSTRGYYNPRRNIGVRIMAIPGAKNEQINHKSSDFFYLIFEGTPEAPIGYVALHLLKERLDAVDESDFGVDATPYTYPYLLTYKRRDDKMYVPLKESTTLGYVLSRCHHESAKLAVTRLDLFFAYKVVGPKD